MRRDFSVVLAQHGLNLEQALASADQRTDYTPLEHARDLAGAIRGNLRNASRVGYRSSNGTTGGDGG
jgi:asparagine synthase (glutamine-hydrolysing)